MKPLRNTVIICLVAIISLPQCHKENTPYKPVQVCRDLTNNPDTIKLFIQGTWTWLENRSYDVTGEVFYNTPETVGYRERIIIDTSQITFIRTTKFGLVTKPKSIEKYRYKIVQAGELTTFPSDRDWVFALYDPASGNLLNWWLLYICRNNLILANLHSVEAGSDRIFQKQ